MADRFLAVLLAASFTALGAFSLVSSLLFMLSGATAETMTPLAVSAIIGAGYLLSGWGLYKGRRWAWILAAAFTALNIAGSILSANYLALLVDAVLFVLLLATAKSYGFSPLGRPGKPTSPVPPPSMPVATVYPVRPRRYVRRRSH